MLQDILDTAKEKMKKSCEVYERERHADPDPPDRQHLFPGTPAAGDCSLGSQDDSPD